MDALIEPRLEERREEDGRKAWHCLDCGFCRASKSDVSRHIEQKHIDFSIQCSICPASYTRRDKLKAHMKSKHGMFIWTFSNKNQSNSQICADIDMEVLSKMRSVRGEMGELIWLCCECDYSHIKKTNTFRHVEAKHVVCEYLCPICNQPNSCRNALKQHMIRLHSFGVNKWKTNKWLPRLVNLVCLVFFLLIFSGLMLTIPGALWSGPSIESEAMKKMIPMTNELGLKMWQCSECDYRVKNSNDLRKHVERKHLECRVTCDVCFQVFNCRYRLQQHHRSAHLEPECLWNLKYIQNTFLSANFNQSIVKGEPPSYDQSIKSKMLETQDADGWKLWKCSDCDYTNKKTSHLYRHIERRHFSVTLSCEFCAQTFTCSQALATHQKHSCCS